MYTFANVKIRFLVTFLADILVGRSSIGIRLRARLKNAISSERSAAIEAEKRWTTLNTWTE